MNDRRGGGSVIEFVILGGERMVELLAVILYLRCGWMGGWMDGREINTYLFRRWPVEIWSELLLQRLNWQLVRSMLL